MRQSWVFCVFPLFLHGAESPSTPGSDTLPTGPKPFPSSHYSLIQEYSPFVKSMESAKETEKSPDLVVVGYGRMRGEDHVIVQQKENSEKREKIGSRYGSKDFPYRLLSVTNISDRKTFVAVLEDRNKKKYQIRYATEGSPPPPPALGSGGGQPAAPSMGGGAATPNNPGVGSPSVAPAGVPISNLSNLETPQNLSNQIQVLQSKLNDPSTTGLQRENINKAINAKQLKLNALQSPQDFASPEITPEGQAP